MAEQAGMEKKENLSAISEQNLRALYKKTFGLEPETSEPLKGDGSARTLIRLRGAGRSVIGAIGPDKLENAAFLEFSRQFRKEGLPVPEIYAADAANGVYLEEDLGDTTLFGFLQKERAGTAFPESVKAEYKKALDWLPKFQFQANKSLNYKVCHPRGVFDRQSMMWDLNYFKYYFLRLSGIPFNEQKLEDDFKTFTDFLLEAGHDGFLYRDFQSRNIMLRDGGAWFIDYQGGRKGPPHYDIASLLYDAKADIPPKVRQELLDYYIDRAMEVSKMEREKFMRHFYGFVYVRILQALGAYGLRGFYERKEHFLQSVPYAVKNIEWLLRKAEVPVKLPELMRIFKAMAGSTRLRQFGKPKLGLTARIMSFSYRAGVPTDEKGHGGGFVFDCRCLPNPGREERYMPLTGMDRPVKEYLESIPETKEFLSHVFALIDSAIDAYRSRNFTDLMISFGCTGGRHRSVWCAERLAEHLKENGKAETELNHRELERKLTGSIAVDK